MTPAEWFWQREDLYTENGKCCYIETCDPKCEKDPKTCETWERLYDAECQADEILSE